MSDSSKKAWTFAGLVILPIVLFVTNYLIVRAVVDTSKGSGAAATGVGDAAYVAWAGTSVIAVGLIIGVGWLNGGVFGAFIDGRNRYSLSSVQLAMWTIVVLGAWVGIVMARVAAGFDAFDALEVSIPGTIVAAMGLSGGSFAFSTAIKSQQAKRPTVVSLSAERKAQLSRVDSEINSVNEQLATKKLAMASLEATAGPAKALAKTITELESQLAALTTERTRLTDHEQQARGATGVLVTNDSPSDARPLDLFSGEQVGEANSIDFGKIQMFVVTLAIIGAYGLALAGVIDDGSVFKTGAEFPDLPETLVGIFGLSHAGYLAVKVPTRAP